MQFPPPEQHICFPKSAVSRSKKDMTPQRLLKEVNGSWQIEMERCPRRMSRPSRLRRSLGHLPHKAPSQGPWHPRRTRRVSPVKSATTLPLATASQRLRGRPGRPRTKPVGDDPGDNREPQQTQVRVPPARPAARPQDSPSCAPPGSRLLTRQQAAEYLNLSSDLLDRLTQQGELPRVQLALGTRNVRKVLYDRADLDRLVELSRIV